MVVVPGAWGHTLLVVGSVLLLWDTPHNGVLADEDVKLAKAEDIVDSPRDRQLPLSKPIQFEYFSSLRRKWGRSVSVLPRTTRVGWIGSSDLGVTFVRAIAQAGYNVTVADRCSTRRSEEDPTRNVHFCGARSRSGTPLPAPPRAAKAVAHTAAVIGAHDGSLGFIGQPRGAQERCGGLVQLRVPLG